MIGTLPNVRSTFAFERLVEWRREERERERRREKKQIIEKKKERIVTTILSLLNTPNVFDFSHVHEDCRETRFENLLVAVYRVRRARIGENPERIAREMRKKKGRGSEGKKRGEIVSLEYPREPRILPFSWICRVEFVPPIFREEESSFTDAHGWNSALASDTTHPPYPAATNYRLPRVYRGGTRGVRGGAISSEHCGPIVPIRLRQDGRSDAILI